MTDDMAQIGRARGDRSRRLRQQGAGRPQKPLGGKAYGSIPHLPGSRFGNRRDRGVPRGEARLYLERPRPGDRVVVMEKLDGSCVAVLKKDNEIIPLIRSGYPAAGSVWRQHRLFARWARARADAFAACLGDGDRVVGEWLAQAHGTRYDLTGRQPFVVFDYFRGDRRLPALEAEARVQAHGLAFVPVLAAGPRGVPLPDALAMLGEHGHYGAIDPAEGVVYRRETPGGMVYLAKYVRPEAEPGRYLPGDDDPDRAVWNWPPRARPGWREAAPMETDRMKRGDDVFPTLMDEGLVIETCLPATTDEWAFYRRVYRIERYGRSWWRGTA
jgi:hypothetical protein